MNSTGPYPCAIRPGRVSFVWLNGYHCSASYLFTEPSTISNALKGTRMTSFWNRGMGENKRRWYPFLGAIVGASCALSMT